MSNYIRDKLSLKLNLHLSEGKKTSDVLSDKVIDKIIKYSYTGYGHYEIIWDSRKLFPIALSKLNDNVDVRFTGSQYVILNGGKYGVLFANQYINFDISEYTRYIRNKVLNELLK